MINNSHTSSLFHYTPNKKNLLSILRQGLKYSYCYEEYLGVFIALPMVSFCDIPISRSGEQCTKYGIYAIGLAKDFICNSMNECFGPVIYLRENQVKNFSTNYSDIYGFIKPYESDITRIKFGRKTTIHQIHYDECEWRAIIPEGATLTNGKKCIWFHSKKEYEQWRKQTDSKFIETNTIQFDVKDITFILVHNQNCIPNTIKKIKKLSTIGGKKATEEQKDILISKILSFEQINRDL